MNVHVLLDGCLESQFMEKWENEEGKLHFIESLLCARHYSRSFHVTIFILHNNSIKYYIHFTGGKLNFRENNFIAQGHISSKSRSKPRALRSWPL